MRRRTLLQLLSAPLVTGIRLGAAEPRPNKIIIAGGGIIGASIAMHLAQRGAQVTVLEKVRPGNGATRNSFAWLNAPKLPQSYYELNLMGLLGWRRLCTEIGSDLQVQWGGTVEWMAPGPNVEKFVKKAAGFRKWGYPVSPIDKAEFSRLVPNVNPGELGAATFTPIEGTVDPMHALAVFLRRAEAFGAKVEYPCEVTRLDMAGDRVKGVQTTRGPMEADVVVLASGVDTPRLAQMAGITVPLRHSPGVLAHSAPQARVLDRVALAPGANIKQDPDGRIVTGTDFGTNDHPDASMEAGAQLLKNAEKYIEKIKGVPVESMTLGYRVLPMDGDPIVGFVDRRPNLYVAAMHSGMTMSPIMGQLAALEILDGTSADLLAPYRLARFK